MWLEPHFDQDCLIVHVLPSIELKPSVSILMIGDNWTSLFVFLPNAAPVNKPSPCAFLNNVSLIAYGGCCLSTACGASRGQFCLKNCSNRTRTHSNQHDVRSLLHVLVKFYLFFFTAKIKIFFPLAVV